MPEAPGNLKDIHALQQLIADLRGPDGCPWDRDQSHKTLAPYAIEEVHELVEAIEKNDATHMCEELGDVLFQVVLHSQLAFEQNLFSLPDVIESISKKIVRRHPHVFSDLKVSGLDEIHANWEAIKKIEKKDRPPKLFDIPEGLPALQRAFKIGEKTQKLNFDWLEIKSVLQQLKAEIAELEEAMTELNSVKKTEHLQHEIGDVLFSAAQVARHLEIEPESSLREANRRFLKRFEKMLEVGKVTTEQFKNLTTADKENLWKIAKKEC